jgi:AcrR family transcriptional regulator
MAEALLPKRQRGRDRVAAILSTATALFAEKGYEAVTMTEIAAQSSTAIGSLYRFFPTKDVLVAALLERYGALFAEGLGDIVARAPRLNAVETADALVAMGESLRPQRMVMLKLIEVPDDSLMRRQQLRATFKDALARVLSGLSGRPYAGEDAPVLLLLSLLKAVWSFDPETAAGQLDYGREARDMIALYIGSLARRGDEGSGTR